MQSVHLQLSEELLARVDEAAGDVPRNRWIRRLLEREVDRRESNLSAIDRVLDEAPAEQPSYSGPKMMYRGPVVEEHERLRARSSSQAKRDVRPIPKKGEKR